MSFINRTVHYLNNKVEKREWESGRRSTFKKYQELLRQNIGLPNKQSQSCIILGNGPSINHFDFRATDRIDTFAVNSIAAHPRFSDLKIDYYLCMDPFLFSDQNPSDKEKEWILQVGKHNPNVRYFIPADRANHMLAKKAQEYCDVHFLVTYSRLQFFLNKDLKLDGPIPGFGNVVLYAIYVAICLGYQKIYLVGCDETGILTVLNAHLGKYYDSAYGYKLETEDQEKIVKTNTILPVETSLDILNGTFKDFALLGELAKKHGREIYNASAGSLLRCYPFVALDTIC